MSAFVLVFWTPATTRRSAGSTGRRPKSAKARSRGKCGTRQSNERSEGRMSAPLSMVSVHLCIRWNRGTGRCCWPLSSIRRRGPSATRTRTVAKRALSFPLVPVHQLIFRHVASATMSSAGVGRMSGTCRASVQPSDLAPVVTKGAAPVRRKQWKNCL
jgi:hypothetical protein